MSNETDLDWLARTEHHWPKDAVYVSRHENAVEWHYVELSFKGRGHFTKGQWLTRRAELQNRPSWGEIQDWVNWVVQSSTGLWFGSDREPEIDVVAGHSFINPSSFRLGVTFGDGEVLGDWRDTLEKRPDRTRAEMEVELVKAAFEPFTSIEDNQELSMSNKQDVKQDNGWFERGELPPVGVVCETLAEPELLWAEAEVLAHRDGFAIVWVASEKCGVQCDTPSHFRPIRTERDDLVDVLTKAGIGSYAHLVADAILAAGYRKEPK